MAFSLYASTNDVTTQLNDRQPFTFEALDGLAGGGVTRHEQSGPLQSGATDVGYRLQPRVITLRLVFSAVDDATLDGYRDDLMAAFSPQGDISTFLSVQRDDGEIRTLTCHRMGDVDIALAPELRPGHTHRATLTLRCAKALWSANAVTAGSATYTGLSSWWTAGGTISSYINKNEYPAQGALYTQIGGVRTNNWSAAFVTTPDTSGTPVAYLLYSDLYDTIRRQGDFLAMGINLATWPGTSAMNYHVVEVRSGTTYWRYWDGTTLQTAGTNPVARSLDNIGYYRGNSSAADAWTPQVRKIVFHENLSVAQLNALGPYMLNTLRGTVTLVNDGDVNAYPLITLTGPMIDPVIVNQTTSSTISLAGGTITEGVTWTIDLRDGNKRIYDQAGNSVLGSVTTLPISMASFALPPDPVVAGGTNVITLTAGSVGAAAVFGAQITSQYLSF